MSDDLILNELDRLRGVVANVEAYADSLRIVGKAMQGYRGSGWLFRAHGEHLLDLIHGRDGLTEPDPEQSPQLCAPCKQGDHANHIVSLLNGYCVCQALVHVEVRR